MNRNRSKAIHFIVMCSMGLGFIILTLSPGITVIKSDKLQASDPDAAQVMSVDSNVIPVSDETLPSPTPTMIPSPTPFPVYALEKEGYPAVIDQLIHTYYQAKISCDVDTLRSISSEPSAVIDEDSLKKLIEGIDEYLNLTCYVKKSYLDGEYIVWVYHDIKFIGLKTCAPSLSKLYVLKGSDGEYKIFDGVMPEELKEYFDLRSQDADVLALVNETNELAAKAQETDEDLGTYWSELDSNGVVRTVE